tara:strand:- start:192 stop:407 length:216 start_codon:yes stop_codon:yes gene_type:complete
MTTNNNIRSIKMERDIVEHINEYAGHEYYISPDAIDTYEDDEIIDFMCKTIIGMEKAINSLSSRIQWDDEE